jgi:hypothetical protein
MFVTKSDFDLIPYNIPNLSDNNSFDDYCDQEEEGILKSLLGKSLYDSFIAGLKPEWDATVETVIGNEYSYGNNVWEALTAQTGTAPVAGVNWQLNSEDDGWLILKNGSNYYFGVHEYEWVGLKKMLIPYIFSMYLRDTFDNNSGIGVVIAKGENSKVINPSKRIARAYNVFSHYAGRCGFKKDTLYGFLSQEGEAGTFDYTFDDSFQTFGQYLNFVFKDPGTMNFMNL